MTSLAITNSLLRVERIGALLFPPPFEEPNESGDFAVLELGVDSDVGDWCIRTEQTLRTYAALLRQFRTAGADAVLFIEFASKIPVLRLGTSFLSILADAGISLECAHENA